MKQLRRIIKRGTDLIPLEIKSLQQHKAYLALTTNPLSGRFLFFVKTKQLFSVIVLFPWLLAAFYILFLQSPIYESSAKILVERDEQHDLVNMNMKLWGSRNASLSEIYLTREYIISRELLSHIEQQFAVRDHYQSKHNDFFSRLNKNATQGEFLKYFRGMVNAVVEPETYEIIITTSAFTPEAAKKILIEIIKETKQFVNKVSNTLAKKQYNFAKMKLSLAKDKLFQAGKDVMEWQNQNGLFDPKETAQVVSSVMAKLKGTLVEKQTELITLSSFMQPNSNKIITLTEEIKALKDQIEQQTNLLLGNKEKNGKLNKIMTDFEWIQLQLKFAQAEYQAAQQAFDVAAINLSKNQNLLIQIEAPNLPDEPSKPLPFHDLVNLMFLLLILFVLTKMAIIIVKEHRD